MPREHLSAHCALGANMFGTRELPSDQRAITGLALGSSVQYSWEE